MKWSFLVTLLFLVSSLFASTVKPQSWDAVSYHSLVESSFRHLAYEEDYSSLTSMDTLRTGTKGYDALFLSAKSIESGIRNYLSNQPADRFMIAYKPYVNQSAPIFAISVTGGVEYFQQDKDYFLFLTKGLRVRGKLTDHISINGDWWGAQVRGKLDYAVQHPLLDQYYTREPDVIYIDNLQAAMQYSTENFNFNIGRGRLLDTNQITGSLLLNDRGNDYSYVTAIYKLPHFQIAFLHAGLVADSSYSSNQDIRPDKFLAMHRITWLPSERVQFFIGESVIYGDRNIDYNYLLPLAFWRIIEHNTRDRDNMLVSGGFHWNITPQVALTNTVVLDEFTKSKFFTSWWGNKYAYQANLSYQVTLPVLPRSYQPSRLTAEFTAVRPWTYTHDTMHDKYTHDGLPLGYNLGSNVICYAIEWNYPLHPRLRLDTQTSYARQGALGNSPLLNYASRPKETARWLEGGITDTWRFQSVLSCRPLTHHWVKAGVQIEQVESETVHPTISLGWFTEF